MDWKSFIVADAAVMHGAVCFRGTRIPVSAILDNLAAGETPKRILEQYPSLTSDHLAAAMSYAAELARERVVAVPTKPHRRG
jgi:uncharacterized protein (DUF433 family)